jgi:hypothetical protein
MVNSDNDNDNDNSNSNGGHYAFIAPETHIACALIHRADSLANKATASPTKKGPESNHNITI